MTRLIAATVLLAAALGCEKKGGSGPGAPPSPAGTKDQKQRFDKSLGPNADGTTTLKVDDLDLNCTLVHLTERFTDSDLAKLPDPGFAFGVRQQMGALTDAGLADLASRPSLVLLDVQNSAKLTAKAAASVGRMKNLTWLQLSGSGVTDDWLAALKGLTEPRYLGLGGNAELTDAGLAHLSGMTKLRRLLLSGTKVTGSGLAALAGAKELAHIDLTQTTDAGLRAVAKLGKLHALSEAWTADGQHPKSPAEVWKFTVRGPVTDDGLKAVKAFPNLNELHLDSQAITGASIPFLKTLKTLKVLQVLGTAITPEEQEQLRKALPGCEVR